MGRRTDAVRARSGGRKPSGRWSRLQWALICLMSVCLLLAFVVSAVSHARLEDLKDERAAEQAAFDRRVYRTTVKYRSLIEKYAAEYGLRPAYLAAIILNESSYIPNNYSVDKNGNVLARGLMQLLTSAKVYARGTAYEGREITDEDLFDPDISVCIGANYIRILSDRYGGDPVLVACAYHAGPNNVDYWLYRYSTDHKTLRYSEIPEEDGSRDYARKVVDSYAIYSEFYYKEAGRGAADHSIALRDSARAGADLRFLLRGHDLRQNQLSESALGAGA